MPQKQQNELGPQPQPIKVDTGQEDDYLMLELSSDIQVNAEMIRGYRARDREFQMTLEHVPFDPNLTCPYCQKVFRKGEIQKFKRHVQLILCQVSADDGTVT